MGYIYSVLKTQKGKYIFYCPDFNIYGESDDIANAISNANDAIKNLALNNFIKEGIDLPPVSSLADVSIKLNRLIEETFSTPPSTITHCICTVPSTPEA